MFLSAPPADKVEIISIFSYIYSKKILILLMKLNTIIHNNYKIPSAIITFFPMLIVTGPFLPDFCLSILCVFFILFF